MKGKRDAKSSRKTGTFGQNVQNVCSSSTEEKEITEVTGDIPIMDDSQYQFTGLMEDFGTKRPI